MLNAYIAIAELNYKKKIGVIFDKVDFYVAYVQM